MPSNNLETLDLHNKSNRDIQIVDLRLKKYTFDLDVPRLKSKQRRR